jgi:hypothetical protein
MRSKNLSVAVFVQTDWNPSLAYTQEQCDLYGIDTENVPAGVYWNPDDERWEGHYANLPVYDGAGLLLVPKIAVRRRLIPDYEEYYTANDQGKINDYLEDRLKEILM